MLQLIYELRKNCCGRDGTGKSKVLQEVLADLKSRKENIGVKSVFQLTILHEAHIYFLSPLQDKKNTDLLPYYIEYSHVFDDKLIILKTKSTNKYLTTSNSLWNLDSLRLEDDNAKSDGLFHGREFLLIAQ